MAETFGEALRRRRVDAGVSLRGLATALGVSTVYLSEVERGLRPAMSARLVMAAATFLDADRELLLALAIADRGGLVIEDRGTEASRRAGVTLQRLWPSMTDEDFDALLGHLRGRRSSGR